MNFFTVIPEAQAVVYGNGIYRQVPLYLCDGRVYAKMGGGYVRLSRDGSTSAPKVRWREGLYAPEGAFREDGSFVTYVPPVGDVIEGVAQARVAAE